MINMKKYLVTGGAGFIGTNFIKYLIKKYNNIEIIVLDKLTYASDINNLSWEIENKKIKFIKGDIIDFDLVNSIFKKYDIDYLINFAAESHVDNSIENPEIFIKTNVLGVQNLLNVAKLNWEIGKDENNYPIYKNYKKFIQISTDEVYGSLEKNYDLPKKIKLNNKDIYVYGDELFNENSLINPSSPYSASKASADLIVKSYFYTYKFPINITRCSNNYGMYQHKEKLIPKVIDSILKDEKISLYGDGKNVRDWIYVKDHVRAIDMVINHGKIGEIYNIGGNCELQNIDIIKIIIDYIHKNNTEIEYTLDRLGHDRRYAIDSQKIYKDLGWEPKTNFKKGIEKTIDFYIKKSKKEGLYAKHTT